MRRHVVPEGARPGRADKVLAAAFPEFSRAALQRLFAESRVRIGGRVARQAVRVAAGDVLEFDEPEVRPAELRPVAMPLVVLYEDEHLVVVDKPAGMVVHPGAGTAEDTLVHALLAHCAGRLSGIGGVERPGIVHRLDRWTSGVIVAAKSDRAHRSLASQFARRESVEKLYGALVEGVPGAAAGTIDAPIARHRTQRHRMAVARTGGRESRTDWRLLERFSCGAAWVECRLHTGRTHQIRVHLESVRLPLIGDATYGWKNRLGLEPPPPRVMLHARRLAFRHPVTREAVVAEADWPADFLGTIRLLRSRGGDSGHQRN